MKVKSIILVPGLLTAMFFSCTAYGQNEQLLGGHSPSLAYSTTSHSYYSVHLGYDFAFLLSRKINPWGNIMSGGGWINTSADDHSRPVIAHNPVNDTFLVVQTGIWPYYDLNGHFHTSGGDPGFPEQFMISDAPGAQAYPTLTNDTVNGGFLVTWSDDRNIDGLAIYGQLVGTEGELEGTEFLIASGLFRGQVPSSHSVTYDHVNQRFLVVWNPGESIFGQFINANGTLEGEKFTIVEDLPDDYYPIGCVSVAYDGINQRYLVVWGLRYGSGCTYGQLVSANGMLVGTQIAISGSYSGNPSVAFDNVNQRFLVAWTWGVTDGQFVNPDGTILGDRLFISPMGLLTHDDPPAIAFNPDCGNFLVASVAKDYAEMKDLWAIKSDINYTVVGDPCPSATLTVKMKGYGGKHRSISGAGIKCKKNVCTGQYLPGSEVSINAWVDGSYGNRIAVSWTGCDTMNDNVCNVAMDNDRNVTAKFTKVPKRLR